MSYLSFIICIGSTILSWQLIYWLIPLLKKYLTDIPNERSSHIAPTPRGGGISFVVISAIASVISGFVFKVWTPMICLPLICTPLAVIGLIDDRLDLPPWIRYGAQLFTAFLLIKQSSLYLTSNTYVPEFLIIGILLIGLTAVINFINFMDGLDGLVAGCLLVTLFTSIIVLQAPWPIWTLLGSLIGFLIWNWHPSKIFMGDIGSTFLGAFLGGIILQSNELKDAVGLLLIPMPLLMDAFICVLRRFFAGQNIFQAHRLHLYQRLYLAGWSKPKVSLAYITGCIALASSFLLLGLQWEIYLAILLILIGFFADKNLAISFEAATK